MSEATPSQLAARVFCPHCVEQVEARVEFRYGAHGSFRLGDSVRGSGCAQVVADANVASPCPSCGYDGAWPVEVWLERDRLVAVRPPSRRFNWVQEGNFIELDSVDRPSPKPPSA